MWWINKYMNQSLIYTYISVDFHIKLQNMEATWSQNFDHCMVIGKRSGEANIQLSSFGEPLLSIASDSHSFLRGTKPDVVFCSSTRSYFSSLWFYCDCSVGLRSGRCASLESFHFNTAGHVFMDFILCTASPSCCNRFEPLFPSEGKLQFYSRPRHPIQGGTKVCKQHWLGHGISVLFFTNLFFHLFVIYFLLIGMERDVLGGVLMEKDTHWMNHRTTEGSRKHLWALMPTGVLLSPCVGNRFQDCSSVHGGRSENWWDKTWFDQY